MPGLCCPAFLCPYATALSPPTIFGNVCYKVMTQQSSQPQKPQTGDSDARRFYTDAGKVLRVVVPVCVTVIMVGWLFTKIDFGQLREILANPSIFGSDLCAAGLADRIEQMFVEELAGAGAVRATLHKYIG